MEFILQPWQLYFLMLAGWINREQQEVIEYLLTENQVLKEKLGKKHILLDDDQRRRLAVKGKDPRKKATARGRYAVLTRHDSTLASQVSRQEVGLYPQTEVRGPAAHYKRCRRPRVAIRAGLFTRHNQIAEHLLYLL